VFCLYKINSFKVLDVLCILIIEKDARVYDKWKRKTTAQCMHDAANSGSWKTAVKRKAGFPSNATHAT